MNPAPAQSSVSCSFDRKGSGVIVVSAMVNVETDAPDDVLIILERAGRVLDRRTVRTQRADRFGAEIFISAPPAAFLVTDRGEDLLPGETVTYAIRALGDGVFTAEVRALELLPGADVSTWIRPARPQAEAS